MKRHDEERLIHPDTPLARLRELCAKDKRAAAQIAAQPWCPVELLQELANKSAACLDAVLQNPNSPLSLVRYQRFYPREWSLRDELAPLKNPSLSLWMLEDPLATKTLVRDIIQRCDEASLRRVARQHGGQAILTFCADGLAQPRQNEVIEILLRASNTKEELLAAALQIAAQGEAKLSINGEQRSMQRLPVGIWLDVLDAAEASDRLHLSIIEASDSADIQQKLASSPRASAETLLLLAGSGDDVVQRAAAQNPSAPAVLSALSWAYEYSLRRALTEEELLLLAGAGPSIQCALIADKRTPASIIDALYHDLHKPRTPRSLVYRAGHTNLTEKWRQRALQDIAKNPKLSKEHIESMIHSYAQSVAQNPAAPPELLHRLFEENAPGADGLSPWLRKMTNPLVSAQHLGYASYHAPMHVALAKNPAAPPDLIKRLVETKNIHTWWELAHRTDLTKESFEALAQNHVQLAPPKFSLYCAPSTFTESNNNFILAVLAKNPATPRKILERLMLDPNHHIRSLASRNPGVPGSMREIGESSTQEGKRATKEKSRKSSLRHQCRELQREIKAYQEKYGSLPRFVTLEITKREKTARKRIHLDAPKRKTAHRKNNAILREQKERQSHIDRNDEDT